jgi:hypothetical protein
MTGKGSFYSSGQELSSPTQEQLKDFPAYLKQGCDIARDLVDVLIHFPKLVFAAVNGTLAWSDS